MTNAEKGARLEQAVRRIETSIIESAPTYSEASFQIESNKIITVHGVKHEIDIWVTARPAAGYESTFIFECRNREEKVSKNDIIVFSEKVKVSNATRGFFVGKAFTEDAIAQIALDPRLEFLMAEEIDPSAMPVVETPFRTNFDEENVLVGITTQTRRPMDGYSNELPFELDGEKMVVGQFVDRWHRNFRDWFPGHELPTGAYPFIFEVEMPFQEKTAFLNGVELASMGVFLEGVARVERATVVSAFNIQTRGRTISYAFAEPLEMPDGVLVSMTQFDVTISGPEEGR